MSGDLPGDGGMHESNVARFALDAVAQQQRRDAVCAGVGQCGL